MTYSVAHHHLSQTEPLPRRAQKPRAQQRRAALLLTAMALAVVTLGLLGLALRPQPLAAAPMAQPTPCAGVADIPAAECEALAALFIATDGPSWDNRSNWGSGSPCNWFGVECAGGHVFRLQLPSNGLRGTIPQRLGDLDQLSELDLSDNQLRGPVPLGLCDLVDSVGTADFSYNQLYTTYRQARMCLNGLDADWAQTQTTTPRQVAVTAIATDSITLDWTPISYTTDGGYYEVLTATAPGGPYTLHGTTADKNATSYLVDGLTPGTTYFVRVRTYTPSHADMENDQTSPGDGVVAVTLSDGSPLLVMIYFPADNDLSPYVPSIMQRVRRGTQINPNIRVLFLVDRLGDNNTALFTIDQGAIMTTTAVQDIWGVDELNTTDPAVLSWFLTYGRDQYPGARTVVSLMGHGLGQIVEFDWIVGEDDDGRPIVQPGIPALPRGVDATPGDVTDSGGYLSTIDFGKALAAATDNGNAPFDLLFFDQCFQGNLDVLYEVRNAADVIIASPNYAWLAAPYHQYMAAFAPAATPETMAQAVVRLYQAALTRGHPNSIFWLRSADIVPIANAVNGLSQALQSALASDRAAPIGLAAWDALYVDTTQCGRVQFELGPPDELMGAGSFARNLRDHFSAGDPDGVYAAAGTLLDELQAVTTVAVTGTPYIAPDAVWDYRDSITLLAPLARDAPSNVAWRASNYREVTTPITAIWSPAPEQTVLISTTLAFVAEGEWDAFIDAWYTSPLTPTIGEWCQYIPPALVTSEVTETLALALSPGSTDLSLNWTPTTDDDATAYWILVRRASDVSWTVLDTVELSQTSYTTTLPDPATTDAYQVLAQDPLGVTKAQSNEADYSTAPNEQRVYLPLLSTEP